MNEPRDTKKTFIKQGKKPSMSDRKSSTSIPLSTYAHKKTEKLVTALYMVTDCMDHDEPLKSKLRTIGVQLLSDMFALRTATPLALLSLVTLSFTRIDEVNTFVSIASTIGLVSEMNASILKKEFGALRHELEVYQSTHTSPATSVFTETSHLENSRAGAVTLDETMFTLNEVVHTNKHNPKQAPLYTPGRRLKDIHKDRSYDRMIAPSVAHKQLSGELRPSTSNKSIEADIAESKEDRASKIVALISDISARVGKPEVSIKDISSSFVQYSEKTIQRDLNALVLQGTLSKIGEKRSSRYMLVK